MARLIREMAMEAALAAEAVEKQRDQELVANRIRLHREWLNSVFPPGVKLECVAPPRDARDMSSEWKIANDFYVLVHDDREDGTYQGNYGSSQRKTPNGCSTVVYNDFRTFEQLGKVMLRIQRDKERRDALKIR
jgi:hypothetical protein